MNENSRLPEGYAVDGFSKLSHGIYYISELIKRPKQFLLIFSIVDIISQDILEPLVTFVALLFLGASFSLDINLKGNHFRMQIFHMLMLRIVDTFQKNLKCMFGIGLTLFFLISTTVLLSFRNLSVT